MALLNVLETVLRDLEATVGRQRKGKYVRNSQPVCKDEIWNRKSPKPQALYYLTSTGNGLTGGTRLCNGLHRYH